MPRTIVIGDVHGCADELDALFDRIGTSDGDRVVFVGDLIARGPNSRGVVRTVRRIHACSVLGNHEQRLLLARDAVKSGTAPSWLMPYHHDLLRELDDEDWSFVETFPLWLDVDECGLRVVHAGLVPGIPIAQQRADNLTKMRTIRADGSPSKERGHTLWGALYRGAPHVAFGHNAIDGLQLHPDATGLDTACVYGGALTAMVLAPGQTPPPAEERRSVLVSVPARRRYYDPWVDKP